MCQENIFTPALSDCYLGNTKLKKAGVEVALTPFQQAELVKCMNDISYFIKNYVKIISLDEGLVNFELYPFQENMVKKMDENRFTIFLTSRQMGKCITANSKITVRRSGTKEIRKVSIERFLAKIRGEELPEGFDHGRKPVDGKFLESLKVEGWMIETPAGWKPFKKIFRTIPFEVWHLKLENHMQLRAADHHLVHTQSGNKRLCDLLLSDRVKTTHGWAKVESCIREVEYDYDETLGMMIEVPRKEIMFDVEVDSESHLYYSDGIVSHNTTTTAAFLLHLIVFNKEYSVAILANKGEQAREIMSRVQLMYEELPWWMQPGVKTWNKGSIELGNKSKAFTASTSSSAIRGRSINCVDANTLVTFEDDRQNIYYTTIDKLPSHVDVELAEGDYIHKKDEPDMLDVVSVIRCKVTGEEFIIHHRTDDVDDGYLGNGPAILELVEKYGSHNIDKEIIGVHAPFYWKEEKENENTDLQRIQRVQGDSLQAV